MSVDLVVTCFERTYRDVLSPGYFEAIAAQNGYVPALRTALINNVRDTADARRRAAARIDAGELDRAVFVSEQITAALRATGLRERDLQPIPYFTDWGIVAASIDGPDFMVHWDADVRLSEPCDWISPALDLMKRDPRVAVANPNWEAPTAEREALEARDGFLLGYGFSDQVFLTRRTEMGKAVYAQRCIARWRYPFPNSFEARVDAYLRHASRLRATYQRAIYLHPVPMGTSWPMERRLDRVARSLRMATVSVLRRSPWLPAHLRGL